MKKLSIIASFALAISIGPAAFAWGGLGHRTIAEMAERHLTPKAAENIAKYTGGAPLASFSCYLDDMMSDPYYKERYRGWHASVALPDCTSPLYVREQERECRDGVTAMDFFREYLKGEYRNLPDSLVLESIKCITHIIADFHCPQHVRYTDEHNQGYYQVMFDGKSERYHKVWDTSLIQKVSGYTWRDYGKYAGELDTWKKCQIRKVCKGWAREWFEDAARDVRPLAGTVKEGDVLDDGWVAEWYPLAVQQMQKAAYQLAAALNYIFGD